MELRRKRKDNDIIPKTQGSVLTPSQKTAKPGKREGAVQAGLALPWILLPVSGAGLSLSEKPLENSFLSSQNAGSMLPLSCQLTLVAGRLEVNPIFSSLTMQDHARRLESRGSLAEK